MVVFENRHQTDIYADIFSLAGDMFFTGQCFVIDFFHHLAEYDSLHYKQTQILDSSLFKSHQVILVSR